MAPISEPFKATDRAFPVRAVSVTLPSPVAARAAPQWRQKWKRPSYTRRIFPLTSATCSPLLGERFATWLLTSGVRIVIVLALAWIALRLLGSASARLHKALIGSSTSLERTKRADTILGMVRTTAAILIGIAAGMMVLHETGIDVAPVLATAGIGGLAIGFGAQTLVKDVISGFFLLVEDQVRIGDVVEVAGPARHGRDDPTAHDSAARLVRQRPRRAQRQHHLGVEHDAGLLAIPRRSPGSPP